MTWTPPRMRSAVALVVAALIAGAAGCAAVPARGSEAAGLGASAEPVTTGEAAAAANVAGTADAAAVRNAQTVVQDDDPALTYDGDWRIMSSRSDTGGTSRYLNSAGSVSLTFSGTGISWVSRTTANSGIARVELDGEVLASIDRYSAAAAYAQPVYRISGLANQTHTITLTWTGERNPAASGGNLLLDAFVVTTTATERVVVAPLVDGYSVSWTPIARADGYRVVRTGGDAGAGDETVVVAEVGAGVSLIHDRTARSGVAYTYRVDALDGEGTGLTSSAPYAAVVAPYNGALAAAIADSAACPESTAETTATVTVSTAAQLTAALAAARAGTVIRLNPGTYTGEFKLRDRDGGSAGIWLCGPRTAVLTTGSITTGSALMLNRTAHVTVRGISFADSLKGVTVIESEHVVLRDISVRDVGYEAVHFRTQTSDSYLIGSTISGAGLRTAKYGEGVYVGTSSGNVCAQNGCQTDRTTGIHVVDNDISQTGAQPIEAKEGTRSGSILNNRVRGMAGSDPASTGLILVKGDAWQVVGNDVEVVSGVGLATIFSSDGSGSDTVYAGNRVTGPADYGIWVHRPGWDVSGPYVLCSNTSESAPVANVTCVG